MCHRNLSVYWREHKIVSVLLWMFAGIVESLGDPWGWESCKSQEKETKPGSYLCCFLVNSVNFRKIFFYCGCIIGLFMFIDEKESWKQKSMA